MTIAQTAIAGRYRLIESLGSGGMGNVWLAHDEVLEREVAIKEVLLPPGLDETEREDLVVRTLREARAAARLSHPNVVRIHDVVREDDRPWIVMEYVQARSLMDMIKRDGPLPVQRVAEIGLAVLAALVASHKAGVLHRDVKPSNVLIAQDGRAVLADFGIATFEDGDHAPSRPGLILGSPHYIAPERAQLGVSTAASDLWSLGATLYSAVEGHSPYARSTAAATLIALAIAPPDPTHRAGALLPVLDGLLHKDPRTRMRAAEAESMLRRIAAGEPLPPVRKAHARIARGSARRRAVGAGIAVGVLAGAIGVWAGAGSLAARAGALARQEGVWSSPTVAASVPVAAAPRSEPAAPTRTAPPAGMVWYQDPTGFRVAVPARWPAPVPAAQSRVYLCQPDGSRMLEVGPWQTNSGVLTGLALEERQAGLAGYQRIRMESLSDARYAAAAEWEYVFTDRRLGRLHGVTRGFVIAGEAYLIEWRTSVGAWQANVGTYGQIVDSFQAPQPSRPPV